MLFIINILTISSLNYYCGNTIEHDPRTWGVISKMRITRMIINGDNDWKFEIFCSKAKSYTGKCGNFYSSIHFEGNYIKMQKFNGSLETITYPENIEFDGECALVTTLEPRYVFHYHGVPWIHTSVPTEQPTTQIPTTNVPDTQIPSTPEPFDNSRSFDKNIKDNHINKEPATAAAIASIISVICIFGLITLCYICKYTKPEEIHGDNYELIV